ncbi:MULTISPECIES: hypothetical protein [Streptomyces]|uniref:Uncharacterized protein n=1 Tax=Streptomyces griseocarneus TaxID=51201 RepID=A0ABX7RS63_9ACTN|nr:MULTISPECIES: hypothetical protein [Streptomyces]QSY50323.1 hypothetical protein J3S04_04655 [Streptomyces griseocarneus]
MAKLIELTDDLQVHSHSLMETRSMYDEIFNEGCYDMELPDCPFIVDVGGNIGGRLRKAPVRAG